MLERPERRDPSGAVTNGAHRSRWTVAGLVLVVLAGLFLRFFNHSHLWLDETLSANISRLPLSKITGALRHDGAPPLFYVLLHVWMQVFGAGDVAVRAMSGVFAVAALPATWFAGRRVAGPRGAWVALVILSASPYAARFATEARMYSLLSLLCLLGLLAVLRALERPTLIRLAAVAGVCALLLYTHYWSIYLLAVSGAILVWQGWRKGSRPARLVVVSMAVGCLAFLPWLPVFFYQARHTGTPWASPSKPWVLPSVLIDYAGGAAPTSTANLLLLFALLCLGLFGRAADARHIELDLGTQPTARWLAAVFWGTLVVALLAGYPAHATFVGRYTSVVFPLFVLWATLGALLFLDRRVLMAVLASVAVLGVSAGMAGATSEKSQGGQVAHVLDQQARPGDLVVFCPDQLGPAVHRYLHRPLDQVTWPSARGPALVDWVDYRQRIRRASPTAFASAMSARAGGHDLWLVWRKGYGGLGKTCTTLHDSLLLLRPGGVAVLQPKVTADFEHEGLVRYPAGHQG